MESQAKWGSQTGPRSTFCKDHLEESMSVCTTLNQRVTTVHLKIIYSPSCHLQSVGFSVELKSRISKNITSIIFLELEKICEDSSKFKILKFHTIQVKNNM